MGLEAALGASHVDDLMFIQCFQQSCALFYPVCQIRSFLPGFFVELEFI